MCSFWIVSFFFGNHWYNGVVIGVHVIQLFGQQWKKIPFKNSQIRVMIPFANKINRSLLPTHPSLKKFIRIPQQLFELAQWRRSVVKYGGQGQSSQAIKLCQITPYVNDLQTLSNPGSWQPVGASISLFYHPFKHIFHSWRCETCRVIQQQFWMKGCDILGGQSIL